MKSFRVYFVAAAVAIAVPAILAIELNNPQTDVCGVSLDLPDYLVVNDDDDQPVTSADYEIWDKKHCPSEVDDDLREMTVSGTAGQVAGILKLSIISGVDGSDNKISSECDGVILWEDPSKITAALGREWPVPPNTTLTKTFWIEGNLNSGTVGDVKMNATFTTEGGTGRDGIDYYPASKEANAETTVYQVDLDVDSNNNNEFAFDGFNDVDDVEDQIEASEKVGAYGLMRPGKVVVSSSQTNSDDDIVPDFADGFNLVNDLVNGVKVFESVGEGLQFVPVQVELKEPFDIARAKVKFTYGPVSKPERSAEGIADGIGLTGTGTTGDPYVFNLNKGGMRLWKNKATERTSGVAVPVGDFIPADTEIMWFAIATDSSTPRIAKLYLEYVDKNPAEAVGRNNIKVLATQDTVECEDKANLTLTLDIDTDGDRLTDEEELLLGTDPTNPDTDGDGLEDGDEIDAETNPLVADSDADGVNDGAEVHYAGSFFKLVQGAFTYPQAAADAAAKHGRVASFPETDDYSRMASKARQTTQGYLWIGLSDAAAEGAWLWTDGTTPTYSWWPAGEPSGGATENHVVIMEYSTLWADTSENDVAAGYIFERVGLDPLDPDTDGDELPDGWEHDNFLNPLNDTDAALNPDNDGLTNLEEYQHGTDPNKPDTDGDGISDGQEVLNGTDPTKLDTDDDGLDDGDEIVAETNPLDPDTDDDGLDDGDEIIAETSPLDPDTDDDELPDGWEIAHGLNPKNSSDAANLFTGSSVTNLEAFNAGVQANPNATPTDKDGDGLNDAEDAHPNDGEINWPKTPESKYVWIEQMTTPSDISGSPILPIAVNSSGQILFPQYTAGQYRFQHQSTQKPSLGQHRAPVGGPPPQRLPSHPDRCLPRLHRHGSSRRIHRHQRRRHRLRPCSWRRLLVSVHRSAHTGLSVHKPP